MTRLAVIGTAGRRDDGPRLDARLYADMVRVAEGIAGRIDGNVTLVSGGAAWADHVAVGLFLKKDRPANVAALELHLPFALDDATVLDASARTQDGRTTRYYHERFAKALGRDDALATLRRLDDARQAGAALSGYPGGFKSRNLGIVGTADIVLAFTFGDPASAFDIARGPRSARAAGLKDGGTAHSWDRAPSEALKIHVCLPINAPEAVLAAAHDALAAQPDSRATLFGPAV